MVLVIILLAKGIMFNIDQRWFAAVCVCVYVFARYF